MQGRMVLYCNEPACRPLLLTIWRHPFPVKEVPFAETKELSDHNRPAAPEAIIRTWFLLSMYVGGAVYWYQTEESAKAFVEFTGTVEPPGTVTGFQFTAPERRGAMNVWGNTKSRIAEITQLRDPFGSPKG